MAIRGNQRSSGVITGHQAHLIRKDEIEQTRSPALQLFTLTKHVRLDRRDIPRGEEQPERLLDDLAFSSAPVAIRGTQQWQSVAISGTQWHSMAINGTQWHSVALSSAPVAADSLDAFRVETRRCMLVLVHVAHVPVAHQWQSVAMKRPSVAIRGHQRPSKAIRGHHQRSSEAIRGHQWPSSRAQVAHVPLLGAQDARVVHLLHLELHGMRIRSGHLQLEAIRGNQ